MSGPDFVQQLKAWWLFELKILTKMLSTLSSPEQLSKIMSIHISLMPFYIVTRLNTTCFCFFLNILIYKIDQAKLYFKNKNYMFLSYQEVCYEENLYSEKFRSVVMLLYWLRRLLAMGQSKRGLCRAFSYINLNPTLKGSSSTCGCLLFNSY